MVLEQYYHPGTCTAVVRKKHQLEPKPQTFDEPGNKKWKDKKTRNWGPWSCCGGAVNSKGCQTRVHRRGIGAYIQFLNKEKSRILVIGKTSKVYQLSTGVVAKKTDKADPRLLSMLAGNEIDNDYLGLSFSRLSAGDSSKPWVWAHDYDLHILLSRLNVKKPERLIYSPGKWGYHTKAHNSQIMPGFSLTPPGVEICGRYKVVYLAALRFDPRRRKANVFLRCQPEQGTLVIKRSSHPFHIGVGDRLGSNARSTITSPAIFDGQVNLGRQSDDMDRYFGPGYNFYGFCPTSEASLSYPNKADNASLIVTKRNDNKGRLYKVEKRKAFKLRTRVRGTWKKDVASSIEEEAIEAKRICKCRHFSFLCRELGLPCSASALITSFVTDQQPYIFAEPGDIWIDIRLTTPVRTYVLARRA